MPRIPRKSRQLSNIPSDSASARCGDRIGRRTRVTEWLTPVYLSSSPELNSFDGKKDRKGIEPCARLVFLNLDIFAMSLRLNVSDSEPNLKKKKKKFASPRGLSLVTEGRFVPDLPRRTRTREPRALLYSTGWKETAEMRPHKESSFIPDLGQVSGLPTHLPVAPSSVPYGIEYGRRKNIISNAHSTPTEFAVFVKTYSKPADITEATSAHIKALKAFQDYRNRPILRSRWDGERGSK